MKKLTLPIFALLALSLCLTAPATAQFNNTNATAGNNCSTGGGPLLGIDSSGNLVGCKGGGSSRTWQGDANSTVTQTNKTFDTGGTGNVFKSQGTTLANVVGRVGTFQGTTSTPITDTNLTVLSGPSISIAASGINVVNKGLRIKFSGVYTNAAASLLNVDVAFCTVSGCASGTVLAPAGCVVTSTNQANNLTNGQFTGECEIITATTGATGTVMAKATAGFNLGAATSAVQSRFADTATAVSAAVDLTVAEFIHPRFKFSTSNPGNSATLHALIIEYF